MYNIGTLLYSWKLAQIDQNTIFMEKTLDICSLLPCQRMPHPKFCGENLLLFHKFIIIVVVILIQWCGVPAIIVHYIKSSFTSMP